MEHQSRARRSPDTARGFDARAAGPDRATLFAEDFDRTSHQNAVSRPAGAEPSYNAAELAEARADAWARGHAAGVQEANATIAATACVQLEAIATALRDAKTVATQAAESLVGDIARLLMDSLATLFPALCARHGEAELNAMIAAILPALAQEPALMRELDRLDPDLIERVRLVPVEALAVGDLRISWRDGAATRDTASLWQRVRDVLEPVGLLSPVPPTISQGAGMLHWAPDTAAMANQTSRSIKEVAHAQ
jgi:hypothetical protein